MDGVISIRRRGRPPKAHLKGLVFWQRISARRRLAVLRLVEALELCRDLGVDLPVDLLAVSVPPEDAA